MKETKYVAFSTQKGGVGKTTLTVLVASYLHYVKGYDVAVIDCDFPQYSIHRNLFCSYRHYTNNRCADEGRTEVNGARALSPN